MTQNQHSQFGVELGLLITCSISAVAVMAAFANYLYTENYYGGQVPNEGGAGFSANFFLLLLSIATVLSSAISFIYLGILFAFKRGIPRSWLRYSSYLLLLPFSLCLLRIAYVALRR